MGWGQRLCWTSRGSVWKAFQWDWGVGEGRERRGVSLGNPHKGQRESRLASFWPARDKGNGEGAKHCLFHWSAFLTAPNYVGAHFATADNDEGQGILKYSGHVYCLLLFI